MEETKAIRVKNRVKKTAVPMIALSVAIAVGFVAEYAATGSIETAPVGLVPILGAAFGLSLLLTN